MDNKLLIQKLKERVIRAQDTLEKTKKRIQDNCNHPFLGLNFTYGATTTTYGNATHHSMNIECTNCGAVFRSHLVEHKDPL